MGGVKIWLSIRWGYPLGGPGWYTISFMDGISGMRGWRWILVLEGVPTVILGISALFWLANDPETAHFLSSNERDLVVRRMQRQIGHTISSGELHKKDAYTGFLD